MRVAMLSDHGCIRVIKEGTALSRAGADVVYLHRRTAELFVDVIGAEYRYRTPEGLRAKLQKIDPDIVHVHAEPAELVLEARAALPDTPIVFDVHDSELMRQELDLPEERAAFLLADSLILPSEAYRKGIAELRPVETKGKSLRVVRPFLAEWMMPDLEPYPAVEAIVYQGGSLPTADLKPEIAYRDFRDVVRATNRNGIPFFVQSANAKGVDYLAAEDGLAFPPVPYPIMLRRLSRFAYGLVAPGTFPSPHIDVCFPNKLCEYLAAGIPVLVWGAAEVAEWVLEKGVGVVLEHPDELTRARWDELLEIRYHYANRVLAIRESLTMETQLPAIFASYNEATKHRIRALATRELAKQEGGDT